MRNNSILSTMRMAFSVNALKVWILQDHLPPPTPISFLQPSYAPRKRQENISLICLLVERSLMLIRIEVCLSSYHKPLLLYYSHRQDYRRNSRCTVGARSGGKHWAICVLEFLILLRLRSCLLIGSIVCSNRFATESVLRHWRWICKLRLS
jgi:hypothetical protein